MMSVDDVRRGKLAHLPRKDRRGAKRQIRAKRELNSIRDEAEQLMLDFDSMTPFEKTYLTRTVFLYPFLKASTKWPFMYAGERPITAGLVGLTGLAGDRATESLYGPRPDLPAWMEGYTQTPWGYWPVGSVAPTAAALGIFESLANIGQKPEVGIQRPFDYLNPGLQMVLNLMQGQTKFGQAATPGAILRGELPLPTLARPYVPVVGRKPSNIYAQRDFWHNLIRALRGPFQINASEALSQSSQR